MRALLLASAVASLALATRSAAAPQEPAPPLDEVWVSVERPGALERLHALASDLDDHRRAPDGRAIVYADDAEQARLARAGFELEVVQEDLVSHAAERAAAELAALGPGAGSMGGYRTLAEIGAFLDALRAAHPTLVSARLTLGTSVEGRPIWAVRLSDEPALDEPHEPLVLYDALHHAREAITAESLLRFAEGLVLSYARDEDVRRVLHTRSLLLVPCVNPDGYEHNRLTAPMGGGLWRKNRRDNGDGSHGVDLNRNYGFEWGPQWPNASSGAPSAADYRGASPFSEPEARALRDLQLARAPSVRLSAHSAAGLWLIPYGYSAVLAPDHERLLAWAQDFAAGTGYEAGAPWQVLYPANGNAIDWSYATLGSFSFTPEIGDPQEGFWPPPSRIPALCELVRPAYLEAARRAGAWVALESWQTRELAGDGDGWLEPGEEHELVLALANPGLAPAVGEARVAGGAPALELVVARAPFALAASAAPPPAPLAAAPLAAAPTNSSTVGPYVRATPVPLPLRVRVAGDAPPGPVALTLELDYEGFVSTRSLTLTLGQRRVLARDDFELDVPGWTATTSPPAASFGFTRADPQATQSGGQVLQPGDDHTPAPGARCWVTGPAAGFFPGQNEVHGSAQLVSPRLDLSPFQRVELSFARWMADFGGPADDRLRVEASRDDGASWVLLEESAHAPAWAVRALALEEHLPLGDAMRLRFTVADVPDDDLCEALIDDLELATRSSSPTLFAYGPGALGERPRVRLDGPPGVPWRLYASDARSSGTRVPGVEGTWWLAEPAVELASGTTDAEGSALLELVAPRQRHLQAVLDPGGPQASSTNAIELR